MADLNEKYVEEDKQHVKEGEEYDKTKNLLKKLNDMFKIEFFLGAGEKRGDGQ